jgi:hypothetical protein
MTRALEWLSKTDVAGDRQIFSASCGPTTADRPAGSENLVAEDSTTLGWLKSVNHRLNIALHHSGKESE